MVRIAIPTWISEMIGSSSQLLKTEDPDLIMMRRAFIPQIVNLSSPPTNSSFQKKTVPYWSHDGMIMAWCSNYLSGMSIGSSFLQGCFYILVCPDKRSCFVKPPPKSSPELSLPLIFVPEMAPGKVGVLLIGTLSHGKENLGGHCYDRTSLGGAWYWPNMTRARWLTNTMTEIIR